MPTTNAIAPTQAPPQAAAPNSFGYDLAASAAKRVFRNKVLFRLDGKIPLPSFIQHAARSLGDKMLPLTEGTKTYDELLNINIDLVKAGSGPREMIKTMRSNFANFGLDKNSNLFSIVGKTVIRGNLQDLANPLSAGRAFEAVTRTGFMGLAASGVISKSAHQYKQSHSFLSAGETMIKEGLKSGISWEAGTAGRMMAIALIPIEEWSPVVGIAGMALASVGSKHLLDNVS